MVQPPASSDPVPRAALYSFLFGYFPLIPGTYTQAMNLYGLIKPHQRVSIVGPNPSMPPKREMNSLDK